MLVGGATGSGKTTTVAAIVDEINRRDAKHIITIEDPIEYEHTNQQSVIQQVEIGIDAPDFPTALRSALRQAPDVIVVGEMRDPETMQIALAAGETGHLVLSTLHTTDVPSTIARMTDSFPGRAAADDPAGDRGRALGGVRADAAAAVGGGRVPAAELLVVQYGARQHIRRNALHHLHQEITITRKHGSFTLEEGLARLVKAGLVERAEAALRANHAEDFESGDERVDDLVSASGTHGLSRRLVLCLIILVGRIRRARGRPPHPRRHRRVAGVPVAVHAGSAGRPSAAAERARPVHDGRVQHRPRDQPAGRARRRADWPEGAGRAPRRRARRLARAVGAGAARRDVLQAARSAAATAAGDGRRWRVINGGVQGYGPVQEWFFFDHVAAAFQPDIVLIVAFVGNDAIEAHDTAALAERAGSRCATSRDRR